LDESWDLTVGPSPTPTTHSLPEAPERWPVRFFELMAPAAAEIV